MVEKRRLFGLFVLIFAVTAGWSSESKDVVRYGAKVVRAQLGPDSEKPQVRITDGVGLWKLCEGEAFTGVNAHEFYFSVESPVKEATPPRVQIEWPGVKIARVLGADGSVSNTVAGVEFKLSGRRSPTSIGTSLTYGSIHMHLFHNWIVRRAGFYREGEWPANQIQAQLNYLFAAREMCKAMGYASSDNPGFNGDIRLYGFETNFPNGHKDHPPHFHIMLGWPGWLGTQAGHCHLDNKGRILGNVVSSDNGKSMKSNTYKPGEVAQMLDPDGKVGFEVIVMPDGDGVVMRRAAGKTEFFMRADKSDGGAMKCISVGRRDPGVKAEELLCSVRATDNAETGKMLVTVTDASGKVSEEMYSYDVDTGGLLKK